MSNLLASSLFALKFSYLQFIYVFYTLAIWYDSEKAILLTYKKIRDIQK